jgi:hypothetical protein
MDGERGELRAEMTIDDLRAALGRRPLADVDIRKAERRSKELGPSAVAAAVELLQVGTTPQEVMSAFTLLHFNDCTVEATADDDEAPLRIVAPDGREWTVTVAEIADEDLPPSADEGQEMTQRDLGKMWFAEALLGLASAAITWWGLRSDGAPRVVLLVLGVSGLGLAAYTSFWALLVTGVFEFAKRHRSDDTDEER